MPAIVDLTYLWRSNPIEAAKRCRKALDASKGNKTAAAKLLGVSPRTFFRWVEANKEYFK